MEAKYSSRADRIVFILSCSTVLLAPILSFSVQPMTGKFLLPAMGGSSTTWLTTLIFFQFTVLAGYLLAYGLISLELRKQVILTVALAIMASLWARFPPILEHWEPGILSLISGLMLSLFLPVVFLFSVGIIMHAWLGAFRGSIPWYLYALSNLGSIIALVLYPFLIEHSLGLSAQVFLWRFALALLAGLILVLGWLRIRRGEVRGLNKASQEAIPETTESAKPLNWLAYSFLSCLLFMAVTRELTAELGSHPLAWTLPLAIYLGSFSLTFTGIWKPIFSEFSAYIFLLLFATLAYFQGLEIKGLDAHSILILMGLVGAGCVSFNGTLYGLKPVRAFGLFYIMIALGGVLAGLFSTFAAPLIFSRNYELYLAAAGIPYLLVAHGSGLKPFLKWPALISLSAVSLAFLWQDLAQLKDTPGKEQHFMRSIYSQNILVVEEGRLSLNSEATLHGSQFTHPSRRAEPTAYYYRESPVGVLFNFMNTNDKGPRRMGIVGLGAGALAAYGRNGDEMIFWDIDPEMLNIARNFFYYVNDSPAEIELVLQDGRIGVRQTEGPLDLLIIDAFTGDYVPTHLLTLEAFEEFIAKTSDGWLVFHISSRWMDVTPVIQANLRALGREGVRIKNRSDLKSARHEDILPCAYVVVPPEEKMEAYLDYLRDEASRNKYISEMFKLPKVEFQDVLWTDDKHSVTQLLNLGAGASE